VSYHARKVEHRQFPRQPGDRQVSRVMEGRGLYHGARFCLPEQSVERRRGREAKIVPRSAGSGSSSSSSSHAMRAARAACSVLGLLCVATGRRHPVALGHRSRPSALTSGSPTGTPPRSADWWFPPACTRPGRSLSQGRGGRYRRHTPCVHARPRTGRGDHWSFLLLSCPCVNSVNMGDRCQIKREEVVFGR
jgi:hypothetical protein